MSKRPIRTLEGELLPAAEPDTPAQAARPPVWPMLGFQYTAVEIGFAGGHTRLRGESGRFEDGRLRRERFEATAGPEAWFTALEHMQRQMAAAAALMQAPMRLFLPWLGR